MKTLIENWKTAYKDKRFGIFFLGVFVFFLICAFTIRWFLVFNESRAGIIFDDPVLKLFKPKDFTWFIFFIEHTSILTALYLMLQKPHHFARFGIAYSLLLLFRMATMWLVPLEPPPFMIILQDPLISTFTHSVTPVKDLFFSGHTATLFLIFWCLEKSKVRRIYLINAFIVAILIVGQHAHYSIDVLAAPAFALLAFKLATSFCLRFKFLKMA